MHFPRIQTIAGLFAVASSLVAADFDQAYCSSQNSGNTDSYYTQYQSNGECTKHCNSLGTYAFAVIKYSNCWCSNYVPASQTDISQCQEDCPGYPADKCGSKDKGLFIYIGLGPSPSGTQGSSQPSSPAVSSVAPIPAPTEKTSSVKAPTPPQVITSIVRPNPVTIVQTVVGEEPSKTASSSAEPSFLSSEPPPSSTMKTVTSAASSPPTNKPVTTPVVLTESGVVITRTVVVSPTSVPARTDDDNSSPNTGAIIGGAVGGVVGILAVVGGILFLLWRRRKQQRLEQEDGGGGSASGISRNVSTMSKAGLLGSSREKNSQYPSPIATNFGSQRSRYDGEPGSPMTGSERRYSQPITVDSRLNPRAVLAFHGNDSRESIGTIDDSQDYGRQLNVVNPDLTHHD